MSLPRSAAQYVRTRSDEFREHLPSPEEEWSFSEVGLSKPDHYRLADEGLIKKTHRVYEKERQYRVQYWRTTRKLWDSL